MKHSFFSRTLTVFAALVLALGAQSASAQVFATWDNAALNVDAAVPAATGTGTISRGPGIAFSSGANSFSSTNWLVGTPNDIAQNKYVQIAVSTVGQTGDIRLNLTDRRSATGPANVDVYYSADGTNYTFFSTLNTSTTDSTRQITFTGITSIRNNANAAFRLYGYGATATTGTFRVFGISVENVAVGSPNNIVVGAVYTSNAAATEVTVRFLTAPSITPTAAHFSINDASGATVTSVNNVDANTVVLTLSAPASGDLTVDTLTINNGFDVVNTPPNANHRPDFISGVATLQALRGTVNQAGDWLTTLPANTNVTVRGVLVNKSVSTGGTGGGNLRNAWIQEGAFGLQIRGISDSDKVGAQGEVGDEMLFTGNFGHFRGLQQAFGRTNNTVSLLANLGPATIPPVNTLNALTATAAQYEAAESTIVVIENVTFDGAPGTFDAAAASYTINGTSTLISVRVDAEVAATFDGQPLPTGTVNVRGVLSQYVNPNAAPYNTSYQVLVRDLSDLNVSSGSSVEGWMLFE